MSQATQEPTTVAGLPVEPVERFVTRRELAGIMGCGLQQQAVRGGLPVERERRELDALTAHENAHGRPGCR